MKNATWIVKTELCQIVKNKENPRVVIEECLDEIEETVDRDSIPASIY